MGAVIAIVFLLLSLPVIGPALSFFGGWMLVM